MSHHGAAPVGAPLVTPGAGTAQRRDALSTPAAHGRGGSPDVHKRPGGCLRQSSGRHKWRPYGGLCSIRRNGQLLTEPDVASRGSARRGATCDARCRNGTTTGRIVHAGGAWAWRQSDVHKRPGGCLRRSSGRHKWRPYGGGRLTRLHGQPSRSFRQPSRIFCQPSCQTQKGYEDRAKPSRTSQPALHGYKCFYQHKPTELRMF